MSSLRLSNVDAAYANASPVLNNVSLTLEPGWTGVVGANGAGKSTLLSILSGSLKPVAGERHLRPRSAEVLLLPQRVDEPDTRTVAFFDTWSARALAWRSRLGLADDEPYRWSTLSFGERKRWQLAAALEHAPDVLLVDEPTNHLDGDGVVIVLDALRQFRGVGVIVSHDRRVLELCERTVEVRHGSARLVALGYDAARAHWQSQDEAARCEAERRRSVARRSAAIHADARRSAAEASRQISSRSRMKDPRDHDARSVGARARVQKAAAVLSRRAAAARTSAERAEVVVPQVPKTLGRTFRFPSSVVRSAHVAALVDATIEIEGRLLATGVHLVVRPGDRIAILGDNGAGKSTLLARLVDGCPLDADQILYLRQEMSAEDVDDLVRGILEQSSDERGELLTRCAALSVEAAALIERRHASPGVARKAQIADALGRGVGAMFLDEPTNHLDLPSIERLEQALAEFPGALVVVTHDQRFCEAIRAEPFRLADGRFARCAQMR